MSQMLWEPTALRYAGIPVIDLHQRRGKETLEVVQKRCREVVALITVCGAGLGVCVPLSIFSLHQRTQMKTVSLQSSQVEKRVAAVTQLNASVETESAQWQKYVGCRERREGWAALSQALGASVPPGLFLEQVQVEIGLDNKETLVMRGFCEHMAGLQQFVAALKKMPFFAKVSLMEANAYTEIGPRGFQFKVDAAGNGALAFASGR